MLAEPQDFSAAFFRVVGLTDSSPPELASGVTTRKMFRLASRADSNLAIDGAGNHIKGSPTRRQVSTMTPERQEDIQQRWVAIDQRLADIELGKVMPDVDDIAAPEESLLDE